MYYEENGDGFPHILIHAWPTDHVLWMFQVPVFSELFRTIAVDLRGFGRSGRPKRDIQVGHLAKDIVDLMDSLGLEKAHICGISLGGIVAERLALDHPGRNQSTVWVGAQCSLDDYTVQLGDTTVSPIELYIEEMSKGYLHLWHNVLKANMRWMFHRNFSTTPIGSYVIRYLFEDRYAKLNADSRPLISVLRSLAKWNIKAEISQVRVPTAIIVGEDDPALPWCEEGHRLLPESKYFPIKHSGHFPIFDQAEYFNKTVLDFFTANTP